MKHAVGFSGQGGAVFWGFRPAATLGPWSVSLGVLMATVAEADVFRLTQSPLTWVIPNGGGKPPTRRRLEDVVYDGATLTASVGRKG
jgi:hypothetical protein